MRKLTAVLLSLLMLVAITGQVSAQGSFYPRGTYNSIGGMNPVGQISIDTIPAAETANATRLVNDAYADKYHAVSITSFLGQPDVPRNIKVTPSGSVTGSLKINGTDIAGSAISEDLSFSDASAVSTTKAYKTVTAITGAFTQDTNQTMDIGTGDVLGLNTLLPYNTVLMATVNGVREGTAPAVTANSTVLALNTVDTNTAPGGHVTKVYYVV